VCFKLLDAQENRLFVRTLYFGKKLFARTVFREVCHVRKLFGAIENEFLCCAL
jgi:hypothetical protein